MELKNQYTLPLCTKLEGLTVIWGVSKFHEYIFGREFTIFTDSKPLLGLLKEKHIVPPTASAKEQR